MNIKQNVTTFHGRGVSENSKQHTWRVTSKHGDMAQKHVNFKARQLMVPLVYLEFWKLNSLKGICQAGGMGS